MARYNNKRMMTGRQVAWRALISVVCLVLAVILLPRDSDKTYSARVDHPWYGRELVAPFEFPLLKSDAALAAERDSVRRNFAPFFRLDPDVRVRMLTQWRTDAARRQQEGALDKSVVAYVSKRLQEVYERGIVMTEEYEKNVTRQRAQAISVISGKTFEAVESSQVFTQKSAYQYIVSGADSTLCSATELQALGLAAYLQPSLSYDEARSTKALEERLADILPTRGRVLKSTRIVDRGEIVTEDIELKIRSLNAELERRGSTISEGYIATIGQALYAAIVLVGFIFYIVIFRFDYAASHRHVWLLAMFVAVMPLITVGIFRAEVLSVYVVPYAMIPIMARIFMDSRTAAMTMLTSVLLSALPLNQPFDFIVIETVAGMVAIYSLRDLSERSQLFKCALYVTLAALLARLSLDLMRNGDVEGIGWLYYICIVIGGVLLLFAYPLLFMIERTFGFTSNVTLVELSNMNNPLMRRLSEEAPGTFQHCLQVANLAAEVANAIGAKSQLVRTGALYHDIGKLDHPAFFTENQRGVNPHDRLTPAQSAKVILSHVSYGLDLADKEGLPTVIRDFIATHHGAGRVGYFYIKEREAHPGEEIDPKPFTYPGPNPSTQEQAILMMCDAVEAASRSLKEYTDETIGQLVDKIIDGQMASGVFVLSPITFKDIATAKKVLKEKLRTIYHTRISYPELK